MTRDKPIKEARLVAALKKAGVATKNDVREIVGEVIERETQPNGKIFEAVTDILADFYTGHIQPELHGLKKEMRQGFD